MSENTEQDPAVTSICSLAPKQSLLGLSKDHSPDKDGPKDNQTDSLKVHDGKLFHFQKYYHHRDQEAMTVLRLAQHLQPDLVLDNDQADQDEIDLVVINEGRPPLNDRELQIIHLRNKHGFNLTFHHKPPCEPDLQALSDEHLMKIKLKSPDETYIPQIQIRYVTSPMTTDSNNIALYFDASDSYYYVHVETDGRSLLLVREDKTKDPRIYYRNHLTFTQKSVNSGFDKVDYAEPVISDPGHRSGSCSLASTPTQKPEPHRFFSEPGCSLWSQFPVLSDGNAPYESHMMDHSVPDTTDLMTNYVSEDTSNNEDQSHAE